MLERSRQLVSSTLLFLFITFSQTRRISHQSGRVHSSTHHPSTSRFNINQSTMTTLLLIDVQKDFHPGGSLAIPTASSDAQRTAQFIRQNASSIHRIVATMDSHQKLHIAHPCFWKNDKGEHPNPFTVISNEDVVTGKWIPRSDLTFPVVPHGVMMDDAVLATGGDVPEKLHGEAGSLDILQWCIEYTKRLESKGRFQLCIWPEHCLIGTERNEGDVILCTTTVEILHFGCES